MNCFFLRSNFFFLRFNFFFLRFIFFFLDVQILFSILTFTFCSSITRLAVAMIRIAIAWSMYPCRRCNPLPVWHYQTISSGYYSRKMTRSVLLLLSPRNVSMSPSTSINSYTWISWNCLPLVLAQRNRNRIIFLTSTTSISRRSLKMRWTRHGWKLASTTTASVPAVIR